MPNIFNKDVCDISQNITISIAVLFSIIVVLFSYYMTPKYTRVGYQPIQPINFDHSLHNSQLGIDCRYCHTYVDKSSHSNIPSANNCMNCHNQIKSDSLELINVRESYNSEYPIPWIRIHKLPDYVYFSHSVHVNRGISCLECHGQVNDMQSVQHIKSLSMSFCLECHRKPEKYIRSLSQVYNFEWKLNDDMAQIEMGRKFIQEWNISPSQSCSACHR